jgi:hypothetical protein
VRWHNLIMDIEIIAAVAARELLPWFGRMSGPASGTLAQGRPV